MRSSPQTMAVRSGKSCALRRRMSPSVRWRKPMANLFRRNAERARAADLAAGVDERTDQAAAVGQALVFGQLVEDLIGRAPDLQLGEKINEAVEAVLSDVLGELAVIFVAGDVGQPLVVEFIVLDRRDGVAA